MSGYHRILLFIFLLVNCGQGDGSQEKAHALDSSIQTLKDAEQSLHYSSSEDGSPEHQPTDALTCSRWLFEGEVSNARDLGGQPLESGEKVACRKLMIGGHLGGLSDNGCTEFVELGIRTVIDLRQANDRQSEPNVSCVVDSAEQVQAVMPKKLPPSVENYLILLDEDQAIATIFSKLGEAQSYPIYIHCVIGRDRASFVAALILLALGADEKTVTEEFLLQNELGITVEEEWMQAVMDEIRNRGGIEEYILSTGVSSDQLKVLREKAVDR